MYFYVYLVLRVSKIELSGILVANYIESKLNYANVRSIAGGKLRFHFHREGLVWWGGESEISRVTQLPPVPPTNLR